MYQFAMSDGPAGGLDAFWRQTEASDEAKGFALQLIAGTRREQERIDELIDAAASNWRLERIAAVDLAVLRVAVFELLEAHDVPAAVAIDEAIDIAKRYGTSEAGGFVNGVLDRIATNLGVKSRGAAEPTE